MKKEQSFINISDKTLASRLGYGVNFDVVRKQVQYQNQNIVFYFFLLWLAKMLSMIF